MKNNYQQIFENARVMFVLKGCGHCRTWKSFIERENMKIKPEKRIIIVDSTLMNEHGIIDDPLLNVFNNFIKGFPSLFIDGKKIGIANSQEEAITFLRSYLYDDYIIPRIKFQDISCEYVKKGVFGKRVLICDGVLTYDGEEDE